MISAFRKQLSVTTQSRNEQTAVSKMLAPISGYEDLAEKATPMHKTLANVIRRLCSRFVRSLGFDKEADIIQKKAGISDEALSELKSNENRKQNRGVRR